ncbi:hypothetical protein pneo_cds_956 [Pandoravirus neocaledonia]|uniref:Uncharacterized protein n=1 Tax=Pandoravirus neocaledonia TaxID=2107708 RepID=A0A2U7UDQ5_9VIRU|nr:hypothetical protein pneo_cds_956 [Pandoravirus neocaledonia]AVK76563.1 hypothetical protein pneo_cds_956 [Pandoravirus neocaledonia]
MERASDAYWWVGQAEARGRKRTVDVAIGPTIRDVAIDVCAALRRGQPVDPRAAQMVVEAARAEGALGSDMDVLFAACSAGMASVALTPSMARGGLSPIGWSGAPLGATPSPTPSSPYEWTLRQPTPTRQQTHEPAPGGRKRRAEEALTPMRSTRDIAVDICRRAYRGEAVSSDEIEALREIARAEGSVGAGLIHDVPGLCRAALTLMGESPASMAALAGASMQARRPAPPPPLPTPAYPRVVHLPLAPRAERFS